MIGFVKTKSCRAFLLGFSLLVAVAGNIARAQGEPDVLKDVEIAQDGTKTMHVDILQPKSSPYHPMPVIFTMHAGGWKDGTYHNCFARGDLAKKGFLIVSIEYHPIGTGDKWPVQLKDCLRAVRWMRANAAQYNADPSHFAAYGESAGAHLATCVAVYGDDPKFADPAYPGISAGVQAVVLGDGPVDILTSEKEHTNPKYKWNIETLLGGTPDQQPDAWNEACMLGHVSGKLPPFFIWHGEPDNVVPIAESIAFVDALKKANVPVEFFPIKNGSHDAFTPYDKTSPVEPDQKTVLEKMVAFLEKNLVK